VSQDKQHTGNGRDGAEAAQAGPGPVQFPPEQGEKEGQASRLEQRGESQGAQR